MGTTTKMTIHRGLSELKLLESRISKQMGAFQPVAVKQNDKIVNGNITVKDFEEKTKSDFDSLMGLFRRKNSIKKAIVDSNAKTIVTIAGERMTVADAITMKTNIVLEKNFVEMLYSRKLNNVALANKSNEAVKARLQELLVASYGKDTTKHDAKIVESTTETYMKLNQFDLVDPLNIEEVINKMSDRVFGFQSEVDAVLSESNATTYIEVED